MYRFHGRRSRPNPVKIAGNSIFTGRDTIAAMPSPQIAIIGRPNVGKSSLLNRLAKRRVSIVDPTPGVTRDRVSITLELEPPIETARGTPTKMVELIDTGGYGVYTAEGARYNEIGADLATLTPHIEQQIATARQKAGLILFVVDAQAGITALDETIAGILRHEGAAERVLVVANKTDDEKWIPHAMESAGLGFGEPLPISATSGHGMRDLLDEMYRRVAAMPAVESGDDQTDEPDMTLAIVGKRNAGKSTLINALAGEPRVIVSEIAGTTRDSIDVRFDIEGRTMLAIDTAGVRKKKSMVDDVEYYAYHRMLSAIRRADVVVLLLDATTEVAQVDQKLAQELQRQFKPTVIVVNKWDLAQDKVKTEAYLDYLTKELRGLDYVPIVFISAKDGDHVTDVIKMAFNLHQQARHRETTGRLNNTIERIMKERGPSSRLGTQAKLYYATQLEVNPPTISIFVNDPKLFRGRYERYLLNRLRDELPFSEVPIRLVFKGRQRLSLDDMKQRGKERGRQRRSRA